MNFLSCRAVSRALAQGALEDASVLIRFLARLHLLYCRYCRKYLRQIRLLGRAARQWSSGLLDPAAEEAFKRRLIQTLR